jgi:hypothetical protein
MFDPNFSPPIDTAVVAAVADLDGKPIGITGITVTLYLGDAQK